MATKDNKIAVFGIYKTRYAVENAVARLKESGFRNADISVLFASPDTAKEFAHQNSTKAPEGSVSGSLAGASVGGILGWLAGIGTLAIPGVGPLVAAGPIMAALAGLGVGGAIGGLVGALVGMGIPEYEAKRYEGLVKDGGILLSVHTGTSEAVKRAKMALEQSGAKDINSSSEVTSGTKSNKSSTGTSATPPSFL